MIIDRALLESVLSEEHISEGVEVKGKDHYEFANGRARMGAAIGCSVLARSRIMKMQMVRSLKSKC